MDFTNKKIIRTYASAHSQNVWANIEGIGWKKVKTLSTDGPTNMFVKLNAAKSHDRTVNGTIDAMDQISALYLN